MKKYHFIQKWGTYENDTLIFIGYTKKEVEISLKKYEDSKPFLENLTEELFKNNRGFVVNADGRRTLLWINEYKNSWEFWDTMIHEINHLVWYIFKEQRGMLDEIEATAYQQEYLIREIRRKLFKHYNHMPCGGKKGGKKKKK